MKPNPFLVSNHLTVPFFTMSEKARTPMKEGVCCEASTERVKLEERMERNMVAVAKLVVVLVVALGVFKYGVQQQSG